MAASSSNRSEVHIKGETWAKIASALAGAGVCIMGAVVYLHGLSMDEIREMRADFRATSGVIGALREDVGELRGEVKVLGKNVPELQRAVQSIAVIANRHLDTVQKLYTTTKTAQKDVRELQEKLDAIADDLKRRIVALERAASISPDEASTALRRLTFAERILEKSMQLIRQGS